jgi:aryl-phospho-beta-D-glucosidase BglC (GH1 family)
MGRMVRVACAALAVVCALAVGAGSARAVQGQGQDWVSIDGARLTHRGQNVLLRGSNFANINALGADIGSNNARDVQYTREDYFKLREMGGNHVRFGMSYTWYASDRAAFWAMLDQQVTWAREAGVFFMPLLFVNPGNCYEGYSNSCSLWQDSRLQQQLVDFWVDVARRYANEPTVFAIDPVNEPTPNQAPWCETVWGVLGRVRDAVLAVNPNLLVFFASCDDAVFYKTLGKNVVYEVHFYAPISFTHASVPDYSNIQCRTGSRYPGQNKEWDGRSYLFNKATMGGEGSARGSMTDIRDRYSIDWAQQNSVPLYVGEWGTQSACTGWQQYLKDVGDLFNEWGVHYAHYSWRANAGNWDTFAAHGPLKIQNHDTYDILTNLWRGNAQPVPVTATSTAMQTATPTHTATATRAAASTAVTAPPTNTPSRTATAVSRVRCARVEIVEGGAIWCYTK